VTGLPEMKRWIVARLCFPVAFRFRFRQVSG
jgi:hypothetical protein